MLSPGLPRLIGPRAHVIACAAVMEDILPYLPVGAECTVLEFGLHADPSSLRRALQKAIDRAAQSAETIILGSEAAFRQQQVVMYGMIMQQDEAVIVPALAAQFNMLVGGYLASKGITLPEGTDLTPVIQAALLGGIALCESDYMAEVNATARFVEKQLKAHKVWGSARH